MGGGKKEKVSTGSSRNSHFCKSMGEKGKQEGRGLMLADALQREKRKGRETGKEKERKLRT